MYHSLDYADFGVSILMKSNQQLLFALLLQTAIGILFIMRSYSGNYYFVPDEEKNYQSL